MLLCKSDADIGVTIGAKGAASAKKPSLPFCLSEFYFLTDLVSLGFH